MIRHFAEKPGGRHQVDRRGRNGGEIQTATETGRPKFVLATENGAGKVFNGNFQGERGREEGKPGYHRYIISLKSYP